MKNVLEFLEKAAERFPDKTGFTDTDREATFMQVMENSKRIASSLKGIPKNMPVAIMLDRNINCIEAMFAAVYAGCFYVVIDIHSPSLRISHISEALEPKAVITDRRMLDMTQMLFESADIIVYEEAVNNKIDTEFITAVRASMIDTDPLYVLFTSGSSGVPKGAVLSHRSIIRYTEWVCGEFGFDSSTSFGSQTPLYFSMSVTDLYSTLKCGATYNIIPKMLFSFPVKLVEYINRRAINTIYWVPSAMAIISNWNVFEYQIPTHMDTVLFAGEVMPVKHLNYWRSFLPDCTYANLFGPTETTDICTFYIVNRDFRDEESLPIGKACNNCDVFLITEDGRRARRGEEGELVVRGSFLACGYYNDPAKTAEAFPQNPLNSRYPERIYRTGDLARLNEKGEFIYINRKDFQIKRMGYRIEPGEIESAASSLKDINTAAVIYDALGDRLLLLYDGRSKDTAQVMRDVKARLPAYMYPDEIIRVRNIPHNANGKIDRAKLKKQFI